MSKNRDFNNRQASEQAEGYKTIETGLPSDRFSEQKQIASADQLGVTSKSTPDNVTNSVSAAKTLKSKIKVKPDISVEDLGSKQVGGVPLAVETGLKNAAGARTMSPADDTSRTPYSPGNYRPTTRYGKKRSEDLFELDNTAIEQVVPVVEDCPDLKEAPTLEIGYNGRQQFKQTRQKKNFQYTDGDGDIQPKIPQQLLNDASVDFCDVDQVVYTNGQVINPINSNGTMGQIDSQADYPTFDGDFTLTGNDVMHKGNYMPTGLRITVSGGHITAISIDEYKFDVVASSVVRDQANMNWQVDANNIAKTMIKIQKEMGRETTDKWTPLAYVINQPYEYNMLLHDIESTTGAIMAAAYRAAVSSLAYQRNITKKDGINPQRNAVKMIVEGYAGVLANNDRNTIADLDFGHTIFNQAAYREGSAAALIDMFDSVNKYQTKADLLGMQRSFGLHLSQADNNIAPFRCKKEFMKALDKAHMFSTVDGNYNPFLPIYETKNIKLILPLSLNRFLKGWKNPALLSDAEKADSRRDQVSGTYAQYMYTYADIRNRYDTYVQHPVIEGLLHWLLKHEGAFVDTYGDGNIYIPFHFDMQNPSMLQFLLCSASQEVAFQRNISFRDVLFAGEQSTYIWDDLVSLKDVDPLYSSQLKIGKYDEPLTLGKLAPDSAIRMFFGDHKQCAYHEDGAVQYFEPWYLNEQAFRKEAGGSYAINRGFYDEDVPFNMSFPSIRDGVRNEYVDLIKSMSLKDVMLSIDRKLDILKYTAINTVRDSNNTTTLYYEVVPNNVANICNNKIKINTLRYDGNSDGRISTEYLLDVGDNLDLHALGLYCIPKELGYIDDQYCSLSVITGVTYNSGTKACVVTTAATNFDDTDTSGINTVYYNGGKNMWVTSYRMEADSPVDGSIDRSAALTSTFYRAFATTDDNIAVVNQNFVDETGLLLSRTWNFAGMQSPKGIYNLGSTNGSSYTMINNITSFVPYDWTMVQRWFMPVNPFANATPVDDIELVFDPFESSFIFGICGFLAADYTQSVLSRLSIYDQLGFDYTEDTNIKDSPIFR